MRQSSRSLITSVLFGLVALGLVGLLSSRFGLVPAFGPFLNPFGGVWKRHASFIEQAKKSLDLPGLEKPVQIVVDRDQITHIFAQSDRDLYFAQGYVLASERLWQMEFLVRTASGRLSEVMGPKTIEIDTYFTRMGLPQAGEQSASLMLADAVTGPALTAYAEGVNAYIATLTPASFPLEYKILGVTPEPWSAKNAGFLLKFMAWSLSGFSQDVPLSRSAHVLGRAAFQELYPLDLPVPEPIVPAGTKWATRTAIPKAPDVEFEPSIESLEPMPTPHPNNGSNNWAVTGRKSTTGLPILSNDIHLGLSLPALWYEMQLVSPTQNVYGITLPGAPGVILGFNKSLAWGVTNGGDDVLDWYQLRFRDEKRSEYLFDGNWRPVISRDVALKVRGEKEPRTLILRETHFGPIVYDNEETPINTSIPKSLAMRWAALGESNELKNFLLMNKAKTVAECRQALDGYRTPAQNFLCVDNTGETAIYHMGRFPLRYRGQGRTVSDGSTSASDWAGWLSADENPFSKNPARGFLSSANQPPTDHDYPFYLGWPYENLSRSSRINEILRSKAKFAPEDFVKMQGDTTSIAAKLETAPLVKALEGVKLEEKEQKAVDLVKAWPGTFEPDSNAAPIAYVWFKQAEFNLWKRLLPERKTFAYPPFVKTVEVLSDPNSRWIDDPRTDKKETLADLVHQSLKEALDEVAEKTGKRDSSSWTWASYRPTEIQHLSKIPGLGAKIAAPGVENAIFANTGSHGPVWKVVVAVGAKPLAYGIYPGGQSGDPMSPHFQDFLDSWQKNEMKKLNFMLKPDDSFDRKEAVIALEPQHAPLTQGAKR